MRSSEAAVPGLFSTRVSDFVDPDDETGEIGAILLSQVDRLKVAYTRCQLFRNSALHVERIDAEIPEIRRGARFEPNSPVAAEI